MLIKLFGPARAAYDIFCISNNKHRQTMYFHIKFYISKAIKVNTNFPLNKYINLKKKMDYPKPCVAFYHHGFINTNFCV